MAGLVSIDPEVRQRFHAAPLASAIGRRGARRLLLPQVLVQGVVLGVVDAVAWAPLGL